MLNREKYADVILDIMCKGAVAVVNDTPVQCSEIDCKDCLLNKSKSWCRRELEKWLNSEYVGPVDQVVDWSKVAIDTPILVCDNGNGWHRRYFAKYENEIVYAYNDGRTSWSTFNNGDITGWNYAELVEVKENVK